MSVDEPFYIVPVGLSATQNESSACVHRSIFFIFWLILGRVAIYFLCAGVHVPRAPSGILLQLASSERLRCSRHRIVELFRYPLLTGCCRYPFFIAKTWLQALELRTVTCWVPMLLAACCCKAPVDQYQNHVLGICSCLHDCTVCCCLFLARLPSTTTDTVRRMLSLDMFCVLVVCERRMYLRYCS